MSSRGATGAPTQSSSPITRPRNHSGVATQRGRRRLSELVERRQPLGHDLGSQRRRCLQRLGEVLRARQADELRAVDVDDVQGDGDAGGAPRLGHQLVGDEVRRHLVEDVGDLERERLGASQAAGRLIGERREPTRGLWLGRGVGAFGFLGERRGEVLAGREVAVERRAPDAGGGRDLGHRGAAVADERLRGDEDALATGERVGAPARRRALWRAIGVLLGILRRSGHHRNGNRSPAACSKVRQNVPTSRDLRTSASDRCMAVRISGVRGTATATFVAQTSHIHFGERDDRIH